MEAEESNEVPIIPSSTSHIFISEVVGLDFPHIYDGNDNYVLYIV